jgi:hypothetical protein
MNDLHEVTAAISGLIRNWCERQELVPLARLLPAHLYNNGLTDGWELLLGAVQDTMDPNRSYLTPDELETLRQVRSTLQQALDSDHGF